MKRIYLLLTLGIVFSLVLSTGCKTTEAGDDCTFNITGSWRISFGFGSSTTFEQTANFSGTATSGTTSGFSSWSDMPGTYTVTNCTNVMFTFPRSNGDLWTFNGTSSSATAMSGTFTWYDSGLDMTNTGNWTATRL
jgi:hypothetical protein